MAKKPDPYEPLKKIAEEHKRKRNKPKVTTKPKQQVKKKPKPTKNILPSLTDEQLNAVYDEALLDRELGMRSLAEYAKLCWPHMDGTRGRPYIEAAWHSDVIAEHIQAVIENQIKRLIISVPPGYGKSSYVAVFGPTWAWIKLPHFKMAFGSYSYTNSVRDSVYCAKLIKSKWWQQRWGHIFELQKADKLDIETNVGGIRKVVSVGGQTLGIRADMVVADDPMNINEVDSAPTRSKVHFWWEHGMRSRGDLDLREIIIMQRLHQDDLAGYLIREIGGYQELTLPAEYDPKRKCVTYTEDGTKFWEDPRTEEGELLFPEKFPRSYLDARRGKDDKSRGQFAAMQQQDPVQPGGNIIKTDWFRYYTETPEERYAKCKKAIVSCDLAIKAKQSSSYTVFQVWGFSHPNLSLIDQIRRRMSFTEKLAVLQLLIDKWNNMPGPIVAPILIEDKASGSDTKEVLQDKIQGIVLVDGNDDKEERVNSITWLWESGNVYIPGRPRQEGDEDKVDFSHVPWMIAWIDEITRFPKSSFTDQVIAMSQVLVYISKQFKTVKGLPTPVAGHGLIYNAQKKQQAARFNSGR